MDLMQTALAARFHDLRGGAAATAQSAANDFRTRLDADRSGDLSRTEVEGHARFERAFERIDGQDGTAADGRVTGREMLDLAADAVPRAAGLVATAWGPLTEPR